jgi:predicted nucleic acid-binding Zn ribbon protein
MDEPQRLGEILDGVGARLGLARAGEARTIWGRWHEIVGAGIAQHSEPTSLRDGILRVRTDSPVWATELAYLAPEIQRRANQLTGRPTVTEVRVRTDPGPVRRAVDGRRTGTAIDARSHRRAASGEGIARADDVDPKRAFERARRAWERARAGFRR